MALGKTYTKTYWPCIKCLFKTEVRWISLKSLEISTASKPGKSPEKWLVLFLMNIALSFSNKKCDFFFTVFYSILYEFQFLQKADFSSHGSVNVDVSSHLLINDPLLRHIPLMAKSLPYMHAIESGESNYRKFWLSWEKRDTAGKNIEPSFSSYLSHRKWPKRPRGLQRKNICEHHLIAEQTAAINFLGSWLQEK